MIDWSRIKELREEVGEEDFEEVYELFLEEVESVLEPLRTASNDMALLEQDMHFLKGSALSLGFETFSQHCHTGEKMASIGQGSTVKLQTIVEAFDQSKSMFESEKETQL